MRLAADSGLWSTGEVPTPAPLTAVLEVSGAVLSWQVDDSAHPPTTQITFTDIRRADWLWRVIGESGHVALTAQALSGPTAPEIELFGVDIDPDVVAPLRLLAFGHWLRRWWPASALDGIMALETALLDAEIALRTVAADHFFSDETLDSDVETLLAPLAAALTVHLAGGDPRVTTLVRACAELADELGVNAPGWPELIAVLDDLPTLRAGFAVRSDYALAAGGPPERPAAGVVGRGVASINWAGVPAGVFDAAENTVGWNIVATGGQPLAVVAVTGSDGAAGIPVRLTSGPLSASGVLDDAGRAVLSVVDTDLVPVTESSAWNHDWSMTEVTVGADVAETPQLRDRVRAFARARLARPGADAYLAEILAAESDY